MVNDQFEKNVSRGQNFESTNMPLFGRVNERVVPEYVVQAVDE